MGVVAVDAFAFMIVFCSFCSSSGFLTNKLLVKATRPLPVSDELVVSITTSRYIWINSSSRYKTSMQQPCSLQQQSLRHSHNFSV
jgi:hypothetical protein